jgi:hypothetical protein
MPLPSKNELGELPPGVHQTTLAELLAHFGQETPRRKIVGERLKRLLSLAMQTGQVAKAIVFGSFVSGTPEPNDVDVFLVMEDTFSLDQVAGETRLVFDHAFAQAHFGASVFWLRRCACFPSEAEMVSGWGLKRNGNHRGIAEVSKESV